MGRFRLNGGNHHEDGVTYTNGQIIETDRDLVKMFKRTNKFSLVHDDDVDAEVPEIEDALKRFGVDVTPVAQAKSLPASIRLFQSGGWYNIVDIETAERLNERAFRSDQIHEKLEAYANNE